MNGLTIDVSNQDYDIDVCLGETQLGGGGGGGGFVTYSGTPVANQIPVFSTVSNVVGNTNLVYDGTSLITPKIKIDYVAEKTLDHGIIFEHTANSNNLKNVGTYSSGFAGQGHNLKYEGGLSSLTIDNLTVRRKLAAYELEIREVTHVGGNLLLSVANGTVTTYTGTDPYNLYFDIDGGANPVMFQIGDHVRAQIWTGRGIDYFDGSVTYVGSDYITVTSSYTPWAGMKLIQDGHPTDPDRQNMIYITASDDNNPYIDMLAGVTDGIFAGHQKCRIGNLTGINDPDFGGELEGYGLYANNVYLKGHLDIVGASGYINISDKPDSLGDINSGEGTKLTGIESGADVTGSHTAAGITGQGSLATLSYVSWLTHLQDIPATLGTPSGSGLFLSADHMGYYSASTWKVYIDNSGNMILGDYTGTAGLSWNQGTGVLNIKGAINITGGAGWANLTDKPDSLSDINSSEATKLSGIETGATVGANWSSNLSNIPATLQAPSGAGLYLSSTYMGYYNGGSWTSYIDNSGNCVFTGVGQFGMIAGANGGIAIHENDIWENSYIGDGGSISVNRIGYNGGTTYYRSFYVYDGKGNDIFVIQPSASTDYVSIGGVLSQDRTQFEVYGTLKVYKTLYVFEGVTLANSSGDVVIGNTSGDTKIKGQVSIGSGATPNSYACLDLIYGKRQNGDPGAFIVPNMTTTQRDNLTAHAGMIIFNTTTVRFNIYIDAWKVMEWQ